MSELPTQNYLHLYRLASMECELMASAALVRIAGHTEDMIRIRTGMLALRYTSWNYDCRDDMSPACQALAARVRLLAQQVSPAEWQWVLEHEANHRAGCSSLKRPKPVCSVSLYQRK